MEQMAPLLDGETMETLLKLLQHPEFLQGAGEGSEAADGVETRQQLEDALRKLISWMQSQVKNRPRGGGLLFLPRWQSSAIESQYRGGGAKADHRNPLENIGVPRSYLAQAEAALNAGDWPILAQSHVRLVMEGLDNLDTRQMNSHIERTIRLFWQDPDKARVVDILKRLQQFQALWAAATGKMAANAGLPYNEAEAVTALDRMARMAEEAPDQRIRDLILPRVEQARAMMKNPRTLDAESWAEYREDWEALGMSTLMSGSRADPAKAEVLQQASKRAGELVREIASLIGGNRVITEGDMAKMGELENLCRSTPAAMFIVVGGEKGLAEIRARLQARTRRW